MWMVHVMFLWHVTPKNFASVMGVLGRVRWIFVSSWGFPVNRMSLKLLGSLILHMLDQISIAVMHVWSVLLWSPVTEAITKLWDICYGGWRVAGFRNVDKMYWGLHLVTKQLQEWRGGEGSGNHDLVLWRNLEMGWEVEFWVFGLVIFRVISCATFCWKAFKCKKYCHHELFFGETVSDWVGVYLQKPKWWTPRSPMFSEASSDSAFKQLTNVAEEADGMFYL